MGEKFSGRCNGWPQCYLKKKQLAMCHCIQFEVAFMGELRYQKEIIASLLLAITLKS